MVKAQIRAFTIEKILILFRRSVYVKEETNNTGEAIGPNISFGTHPLEQIVFSSAVKTVRL
jgi:hypothetical protein